MAALFLVSGSAPAEEQWRSVVESYCLDCHDADSEKGGLNFVRLLDQGTKTDTDSWERALRQIQARQMPPIGKSRPTESEYEAAQKSLVESLDEIAELSPIPGRTDALRRLTRREYQNAIRDLLAIEIDAAELLPADQSSHGFDNVTVGDLSPALLERYIYAAQKISRLAVGAKLNQPEGRTIRLRPDLTQGKHVEGLPPGTRGGVLLNHNFPRSGTYEIRIHLARDRNEHVEGMRGVHKLAVLLDKNPIADFEVRPPKNRDDHTKVDAHLAAKIEVDAGPRALGVTFVNKGNPLLEEIRQPYEAHFNMHRHPRLSPAIFQVTIIGPFDQSGKLETPSRERIFIGGKPEPILRSLMRRAYRRSVTDADLERPMQFYREADNFESGIEAALSAILVSREFLFRVETDPPGMPAGKPYELNDLEIASRLSFFLWSSLPDEQLLAKAEAGVLRENLEQEVKRMLDDPRSAALVDNFADQWLYLRNLESTTPNGRLFPGFDDNLRQAFRRETELLFESVLREDRSVLDLIRPEETF
ncbi:MAG: DUF1592 domain-containing protein, partial [Verrucomicrobiales bacterium]|nr:DUF1592 domain-containing protein [Verrucomicrobiales bacterium]